MNKQRKEWIGYGAVVALLHAAGVGCLLLAAAKRPEFIGLGFLAYTLGQRHAFDADHIVAIDNTIRKLVQERRNPLGVGFYFSLGHSSVVCLMAVALAFAAQWVEGSIPQLKEIGGVVGTTVSGAFLLLIGIWNLVVLCDLYKVFGKVRRKLPVTDELEQALGNRGGIARLLQPLYRFVGRSWHVYPIGFLFGLGFDTASEVALMAISVGALHSGAGVVGLVALPLLFAAGMSLLDTADGIFMTTAYRWGFDKPLRKLYYNMIVTGLSVVAALFVGCVELAQIISAEFGLRGEGWQRLQSLDLGSLGYFLALLFVVTWLASYGLWKFGKLEERLGAE